jgi:hypothetical protein
MTFAAHERYRHDATHTFMLRVKSMALQRASVATWEYGSAFESAASIWGEVLKVLLISQHARDDGAVLQT